MLGSVTPHTAIPTPATSVPAKRTLATPPPRRSNAPAPMSAIATSVAGSPPRRWASFCAAGAHGAMHNTGGAVSSCERLDATREVLPVAGAAVHLLAHEPRGLVRTVLPREHARGHDPVELELLERAEEEVPVDLALADVEVLVHAARRARRVD